MAGTRRTTQAAQCTSGGGSFLYHRKDVENLPFGDYECVYNSEDTFAYLGNDRMEVDLARTLQEFAHFIRNEDAFMETSRAEHCSRWCILGSSIHFSDRELKFKRGHTCRGA